MSLTLAIVAAFAVICIFVSGSAVVLIWRADKFPKKARWIFGCLFGFVGLNIDPRQSTDLFLSFGVQIPVVIGQWSSESGLALKAVFPVIAAVALIKLAAVRQV